MPNTDIKPVGKLRPITPMGPPAPSPQEHMTEQAGEYGVDPSLMNRLVQQESRWNPKAKSSKGAIGLTQLMPQTAARLGKDPNAPLQNIEGGVQEFSRLMKKYRNDYKKALAAYNAGEGRAESDRPLPQETQNYVGAVTQGYEPKPVGKLRPIGQAAQGPGILEKAKSFAQEPIGKSLLGIPGMQEAFGPRLSQWGAEGGWRGTTADIAKLGLGAADFLQSPLGIGSAAIEALTGGAATPWLAAGLGASELSKTPRAIKAAVQQPSPENIQQALLHPAMGLLSAAGASRAETPTAKLGGKVSKTAAAPDTTQADLLAKKPVGRLRPIKPPRVVSAEQRSIEDFQKEMREGLARGPKKPTRGLGQPTDRPSMQSQPLEVEPPTKAKELPRGARQPRPGILSEEQLAKIRSPQTGQAIEKEGLARDRQVTKAQSAEEAEALEAINKARPIAKPTPKDTELASKIQAQMDEVKAPEAIQQPLSKDWFKPLADRLLDRDIVDAKSDVVNLRSILEKRDPEYVQQILERPDVTYWLRDALKAAAQTGDFNSALAHVKEFEQVYNKGFNQATGEMRKWAESVEAARRPQLAPKTPTEAPRKLVEPRTELPKGLTMGEQKTPSFMEAAKKLGIPDKAMNAATNAGLKAWGEAMAAKKPRGEALKDAVRAMIDIKNQTGFIGKGASKEDLAKVGLEPDKGVVPVPGGGESAEGWKGYIKNEVERTREARNLHAGIYDLDSMSDADMLRANSLLKTAKGSREDYEAIYHHLENPSGEYLSPEQHRLLTSEIQPILKDAARAYKKLSKTGLPIEDYTHRIPIRKNTLLERVLLGRGKFSAGPSLSTWAPARKARTMIAFESEGERQVVSVKGNNVYAFEDGKPILMGRKADLENEGEFKQATTKEIESQTGQKYFHNALASSLINYTQLRRAERAYDMLREFTKSPEFANVAQKGGTPPPGWKPSKMGAISKQLQGYNYEPHVREVLDSYYDKMTKGDASALEKANRFLRTTIFFNPLIHVPNIAVHWAVEKGVTGWMPQNWTRIERTTAKAMNAIIHQNKDFLKALDAGAPLQSQRAAVREGTGLLQARMLQELTTNKTTAQKVASALGYANPAKLIKGIYNASSKITWMSNDIAMLQAAYEHMDRKGVSFDEAIKDVSKHIPDYRLPTRIFNSRSLGKLMNSNLTMFGAYHYGALKSYGAMVKDLVGKNVPVAERAKALDRLAMLGLVTFVIYPAIDQLDKLATGNPEAHERRAGASTFIDGLVKVAQRKEDPESVATSIVTPAPGTQTAAEMLVNKRTYGGPIRDPAAPISEQAADVGKYALEKLGPYSTAKYSQSGEPRGEAFDWKRFFAYLMGVRFTEPRLYSTQHPKAMPGAPRGLRP